MKSTAAEDRRRSDEQTCTDAQADTRYAALEAQMKAAAEELERAKHATLRHSELHAKAEADAENERQYERRPRLD